MNGKNILCVAAASIFFGISALAQGVVLLDQTGTLSAGNTYTRVAATGTRPNETCLAGSTPGYFYQTFTITSSGAAPLNIHVSGVEGNTFLDTFVQVNATSFDPNNPLTNCVGANDDSNSLNSWVQLLAPVAGSYTVVVTSFSAGTTGDFRVCATEGTDELAACLETRRAIPTLSQWGMGVLIVLMGLAAGWYVRRRQSA